MPPLSLISQEMSSDVRIIFAIEKVEGDVMTQDRRAMDTRLQHPRVPAAPGGEPVTSPIYQSSTYVLPTPELGAKIAASWHPQRFYTRYGSPNEIGRAPSELQSPC